MFSSIFGKSSMPIKNSNDEQIAKSQQFMQNLNYENNPNLQKNKIKHQQYLNEFTTHVSMTPPEYPIKVKCVNNAKFVEYLFDANDKFIYATTFEDATNKVKNMLNEPNSSIQNLYATFSKSSKKLRISSGNKGYTRSYNGDLSGAPTNGTFLLIPGSSYNYWMVLTSDQAPSMLSNFRQSIQSKVGGKKKSSKKTKKIKKKQRSRKNRYSK